MKQRSLIRGQQEEHEPSLTFSASTSVNHAMMEVDEGKQDQTANKSNPSPQKYGY